jgi:hypothetical protein
MILASNPEVVISMGDHTVKLTNPEGFTARQIVDAVCRLVIDLDGSVHPPYLDFIVVLDDERIWFSLWDQ